MLELTGVSPRRAQWRRAVWLSGSVRERRRFVAMELLQRRRTRHYRLRELPAVVPIRHGRPGTSGSADAFVLHEVFAGGLYDPSPELDAWLASQPGGPRVVDLGANLGFFTLRTLSRYPAARVTAFEPDPENARLLEEVLRRNGVSERVEVVEACAGTVDGWTGFAGGLGCESHVVAAEDGAVRVPVRDVFAHLGHVDLLKIDIEGSEWPLLADPRLGEVLPAAIVLEYHSIDCPAPNAKREAASCLERLGYTVDHRQSDLPDDEPFWGCGVLWAHRLEAPCGSSA